MPPKTYPLPAKPVSSVQQNNNNINNSNNNNVRQQQPQQHSQPQQQPPPLIILPSTTSSSSIPRGTFFSAPQPASPRSNSSTSGGVAGGTGNYSPYSASSPRIPYGSQVGGPSTPAKDFKDLPNTNIEESHIRRKALNISELRTNCDQIYLGQGWKVHWRKWSSKASINTKNSGLQPNMHRSNSQTEQPSPTKRAKSSSSNKNEGTSHPLDSLSSNSIASSQASTSTAINILDQLKTISTQSILSDPIELARLQILEIKSSLSRDNLGFGELECFVQVDSNRISSSSMNGKGKEKEVIQEQEVGTSRTLWIFSVERGLSEVREDDNPILAALATFEFINLSAPSNGTFSHSDLFPSSSATPILSLSTSSVPSGILLSVGLESLQRPYQAFLTSLRESLLIALLNSPDHKNFTATRLEDSIIFLPPSQEPFGISGRRTIAEAVKSTFKLSIQKTGILVQSIVEDIALRSFPTNGTTITTTSPLLLAPFGTEATLIKTYPKSSSNSKTKKVDLLPSDDIEATWKSILSGTGLSITLDETWILCRLTLPPPPIPSIISPPDISTSSSLLDSPSSIETFVEVVWPGSLCLLNGTTPQPLSTPNSTPPRSKPPELQSEFDLLNSETQNILLTAGNRSSKSSNSSSTLALDSTTRRRLAELARRRGKGELMGLSERISKRAEGVGEMIEEMEEERARRDEKEREAEAEALARSLAPVSSINVGTVGIVGGANINLGDPKSNTGISSNISMIGQPINIRTPMSLGGSVTEGPSPADAFERGGNNYSSFLPATPATPATHQPLDTPSTAQLAEIDHLYPSPPGGNGSTAGDSIMTTLDQPMTMDNINSFGTFDWGDDFAGGNGMRSGLPQDFDDGMMMGLTDDDFSFFDDPAPPPSSLPSLNYSGISSAGIVGGMMIPSSSGPSPKFIDHFSHLSGHTPFTSAVSPTSPFGQTSPQLTSPNNMLGYNFDAPHMTSNALGLGGTSTLDQIQIGSPFKTPRTPYSPFLEFQDEDLLNSSTNTIMSTTTSPAYNNSYAPNPSALSIAGTPHPNSLSFPSRSRGSAFDAVSFGNSHLLSDEKYDPRKGKFGLPSPESDSAMDEDQSTSTFNDKSLARRNSTSSTNQTVTWYSTICDPRVTAASQLKRRRRPSLAKKSISASTELGGKKSSRDLVRVRGWLRTETDSEGVGGDTESDEDGMEIDYESVQLELRRDSGFMFVVDSDNGMREGQALGLSLMVLGKSVGKMIDDSDGGKKENSGGTFSVVTKAMSSAESTLEASAAVISDQITHNLAFRSRATEFILAKKEAVSIPTVSAWAIQYVRSRLDKLSILSKQSAANSNLTEMTSTSIVLRAQQSIIQTNPSAVRFWKPMAFEPLAGTKDVAAFVIFEEGGVGLLSAVSSWLKLVTNAYQGLRFGKHTATSTAAIPQGLASVPVGSLSATRAKRDCHTICIQIAEVARTTKHVVVYLLAPPNLSPSATSSLSFVIQQLLKSRSAATTFSMLVYPVPISTITNSKSISADDSATSRFNQLAFSVYDQLLVSIQKIRAPVPETFPSSSSAATVGPFSRLFQAPAITISPSRTTVIKFELSWPPASLEVMHRHRILHVGYKFISAGNLEGVEWVVLSFIDEKGEIWKTVPKLVRSSTSDAGDRAKIKMVWSIAKAVAETADVEWRIVICKLGLISKSELTVWDNILREQVPLTKRAFHVSIVCSDLAPPISLINQFEELPSTPSSSMETRRSSAEEGELTLHVSTPVDTTSPSATFVKQQPGHFDTQPTFAAYTPLDLVVIDSTSNLVAPLTTYIAHIPRFASSSHTSFSTESILSSAPPSSSSSISFLGLHFLTSYHSKSSTLDLTMEEHVRDVRQSFVELATLGRLRWGSSGRIAWHLEAVGQVSEILMRGADGSA